MRFLAVVVCALAVYVACEDDCVKPEEINKLNKQIESLVEEKQTLTDDLAKLSDEMQKLMQSSQTSLDEQTKRVQDIMDEAAEMAKDRNEKITEIEKLTQAIDQSARHVQELRQGLKAAQDESALHLKKIEHLTLESSEAEEERVTTLRNKVLMMQTQLDQLTADLTQAKHSMNLDMVLSDAFDRTVVALNDAYTSAQHLRPWATEKYQQVSSIYDQHGRRQLDPVVKKAQQTVEHVSKLATGVYDQHCRATLDPVLKDMQKTMAPHLSTGKTHLAKLKTHVIELSKETYARFVYGRSTVVEYAAKRNISPEYTLLGVNILVGLLLAPIAAFLIRKLLRFSYLVLIHLIGALCCCFCFGTCRRRRNKPISPVMKLKRPSHKRGKKKQQ